MSQEDDSCNLRPIVIDGSNVAMRWFIYILKLFFILSIAFIKILTNFNNNLLFIFILSKIYFTN